GFQEFLSVASRLQALPFALCSEPEVWQFYNITGDTVSIFRQTDSHQENLQLQERMKIDSDGLTRFIRTNELYYLTEYNDMTAVGLFSSAVRAHLLLLADKRSAGFAQLRELLKALAPQYRGQVSPARRTAPPWRCAALSMSAQLTGFEPSWTASISTGPASSWPMI
ncbi:ERP27 protein, partial [Atractosteus spatula]|nr:ERP27 protein [Atractosteus spatula]